MQTKLTQATNRVGSTVGRTRFVKVATVATAMAALLMAGCASSREIPTNEAAGADEMKLSPCACAQIDYAPAGYRWLGSKEDVTNAG